ncbi:MAG: (Fe-S)-binding protein, partial [Anaerolineales bacterium]|nr:(Fe-S)-binding protein [Anaerolineales bacterium]
HHYPELFASDPKYGPLAENIAARTYEFSQFLVEVLGVTDVNAKCAGRFAYHPSCHLSRGMGITAPPRELLSYVQGGELVEIPGADECCGFGGLFAIKMGEISSAMLARKLDAIQAAHVETVVGCDVSCLLHLSGGLHRRGSKIQTKHLAEILDSHVSPNL